MSAKVPDVAVFDKRVAASREPASRVDLYGDDGDRGEPHQQSRNVPASRDQSQRARHSDREEHAEDPARADVCSPWNPEPQLEDRQPDDPRDDPVSAEGPNAQP